MPSKDDILAYVAQKNAAALKSVGVPSKSSTIPQSVKQIKHSGETSMYPFRKFLVRKNERGLLFKQGDFVKILRPGSYIFLDPAFRVSVDIFPLEVTRFEHRLQEFILNAYPDMCTKEFKVFEFQPTQIGLIYENQKLTEILPPNSRHFYWNGFISVTCEVVDIAKNFTVAPELSAIMLHSLDPGLMRSVQAAIYVMEVPEYHLGLLYVNGKCEQVLSAGMHAYWKFNRNLKIEIIDLRQQGVEVTGQEILTRDKVNLRLNLTASYRVTDPLLCFSKQAKPIEYLYRELQFGLRAAVGTKTLDELLENKEIIDSVVFEHIKNKIAGYGIEVDGVGVKDIILPGEIKTILSKVVETEKAAQANVIRRREETAATRSLLNTAKVMEDNPTALRLKELEVLEKVTEKVEKISVFGGLESLLSELVKLKK